MPKLIADLEDSQSTFELTAGENTIGRLPENTIQLAAGTVSGKHAKIVCIDGEAYLEDSSSRNGTYLNQEKVETRVKLRHNDAILFGRTPARFVSDQVSSKSPTTGFAGLGTVGSGQLEIQPDEDLPPSTISGTIIGETRFGVLDVNPEAKLKAVLDISSSLAGTVDLNDLLPKILDSLFDIFKYADRGCVMLDEGGRMIPRAFKHRRPDIDGTVRLSRTMVNKVLSEKVAILSEDAASDEAFSESESIAELKIHSMMCAPLLGLDAEAIGLISIDSQNPLGQFSQDDLDILMTVAGQSALSYENARLMQTFLEKQKQDNEMQIAKSVQRGLLPTKLPAADGYQFYASYDSAQAVGGDYYDCFDLGEGRIALSFGDVAGKGVPGALIMSRMSSCVQSTLQHVTDVESAMHAINDHMCDSAVEGRFVTYILCIVDTVNHRLTLSNAGHMSPLIRKVDGTVLKFDDELVGPPIGVVDGYPYQAESRSLDPGDIVVIVTDGVDEAMNRENELYGTERVIEFVKTGSSQAEELGKALLGDVRRHANGHPQNDDITIMTFGRNPP